jgi:hypothetical protein
MSVSFLVTMSIKQDTTKIKSPEPKFGFFARIIGSQSLFVLLVIVLTAFASFGLGRLSVKQTTAKDQEILFEQPVFSEKTDKNAGKNTASIALSSNHSGSVVASKTGTKYYFPWCGSASRIKNENRITFNSAEEARIAGYQPATNCKGLQ